MHARSSSMTYRDPSSLRAHWKFTKVACTSLIQLWQRELWESKCPIHTATMTQHPNCIVNHTWKDLMRRVFEREQYVKSLDSVLSALVPCFSPWYKSICPQHSVLWTKLSTHFPPSCAASNSLFTTHKDLDTICEPITPLTFPPDTWKFSHLRFRYPAGSVLHVDLCWLEFCKNKQ